MKSLIISALLLATALAVPRPSVLKKTPLKAYKSGIGGRIVGGQDAEKGEFPWQISYQFDLGDGVAFHSCGGSILNENKIVTAAHCCDGLGIEEARITVGDYTVEDGDQDGTEQIFKISSMKIHENFDMETVDYDVCVLTLAGVIEMNEYAAPISLCTENEWAEGSKFTVTGWGLKSEEDFDISPILQKVEVPYVPQDVCAQDYGDANAITDRMICAGEKGKDSCQGDSGGPMIHLKSESERDLVGIVSWGIGCAEEGYPGVYTRVSSVAEWINENAK